MLSKVEKAHVDAMNKAVKEGVMNDDAEEAFINCSICAALTHLIEVTDYEEVLLVLKDIKRG